MKIKKQYTWRTIRSMVSFCKKQSLRWNVPIIMASCNFVRLLNRSIKKIMWSFPSLIWLKAILKMRCQEFQISLKISRSQVRHFWSSLAAKPAYSFLHTIDFCWFLKRTTYLDFLHKIKLQRKKVSSNWPNFTEL